MLSVPLTPKVSLFSDGHNILIKDDGPRPDTVILDFQILQLADPVADLGKLLLFALSPEVRRANEERLVRKSYDAMLEAGLDGETYPFSLYFDRYKFEGAVAVMMVVSLLDTLMADGKDDEHIVPMIFPLHLRCRTKGGVLRSWFPCRLFLGPGLRLGACWNRLSETVKTRKKREKTGRKWARYSLKGVKEGS